MRTANVSCFNIFAVVAGRGGSLVKKNVFVRKTKELNMKQLPFLLMLIACACFIGLPAAVNGEASADDTAWAVKAAYVDACCCAPSCPCLFGSSPTLGFCEGITLLELEEASYGDVRLDGVQVAAVYRGGTWIKFYVDDDATAEQAEAVVKLLPSFEKFFAIENVVEVQTVPITIERGDGTIKISTPNTTTHIEVMMGNNGQPMRVANLPAPGFPGPPFLDHTQYKTIVLKHEGGEQKFDHTGTNGFTARIDVSSATGH